MESPEEAAEDEGVDYEPDELSMVQHVLKGSGVSYQVIKVPQLVADAWRSAPANTTVAQAVVRPDAAGGFQVESVRVQCGGLTTLKRGSDVGSGGYWFDADFGRREAIQYKGRVGKLTCLVPLLDDKFRSLIRERHTTAATHGGRQTRQDSQVDQSSWDSSSTIFQYYCASSPGGPSGSTSSSGDRRARKTALREDELQLKILNLFEGASSGLQMKQISGAVRQPMNAIKQVLDEIAVQKVRSSDRKVAYFLKKQFAVPDRADRMGKRSRT